MFFLIVQGLVLSVAMLICSLIMYSYPWQGWWTMGLSYVTNIMHCIALHCIAFHCILLWYSLMYILPSVHNITLLDDRVTFIRDGRRHSIVQIAQYTIDRKMREYDCAAKTTRM